MLEQEQEKEMENEIHRPAKEEKQENDMLQVLE